MLPTLAATNVSGESAPHVLRLPGLWSGWLVTSEQESPLDLAKTGSREMCMDVGEIGRLIIP